MEYRLYLSPTIGDGSRQNPKRSKIAQVVSNDGTGQDYWDWIHRELNMRYGLVCADASVHDQLAQDSTIIALSPQFSDLASLNAWLDVPLPQLPPAVMVFLRQDGCSPDQRPEFTTIRQLWSCLETAHATKARQREAQKRGVTVESLGPIPPLHLGPLEF